MAHHLKDLTIELDEKVGTVAAAAEALGGVTRLRREMRGRVVVEHFAERVAVDEPRVALEHPHKARDTLLDVPSGGDVWPSSPTSLRGTRSTARRSAPRMRRAGDGSGRCGGP